MPPTKIANSVFVIGKYCAGAVIRRQVGETKVMGEDGGN